MRDNCGFDGNRAGEAVALSVQLIPDGGKARAAAVSGAR